MIYNVIIIVFSTWLCAFRSVIVRKHTCSGQKAERYGEIWGVGTGEKKKSFKPLHTIIYRYHRIYLSNNDDDDNNNNDNNEYSKKTIYTVYMPQGMYVCTFLHTYIHLSDEYTAIAFHCRHRQGFGNVLTRSDTFTASDSDIIFFPQLYISYIYIHRVTRRMFCGTLYDVCYICCSL